MQFTQVETSSHVAHRWLERKHNKMRPHVPDDMDMASSELESLFLSRDYRYATGDEIRRYFQRGQFKPNEYVLATSYGYFLVADEGDTLALITFIDDISNIVINIKKDRRSA